MSHPPPGRRGKDAWQCLTVFPWRRDRLSDHEEVCMEAIVERCAGIDIGQATVAVTVLVGAAHLRIPVIVIARSGHRDRRFRAS